MNEKQWSQKSHFRKVPLTELSKHFHVHVSRSVHQAELKSKIVLSVVEFTCSFSFEEIILGCTLEAKLVSSSKHLIQVHLKICRKNGFILVEKVYYLKHKLPLIFRNKIIYACHKRDCSRQKLKLWGLCSRKEFSCVVSYLFFRY